MSLGSLYEEAVRKYKEEGFTSLLSSGYYYALAKLAQHSPAFADFFAPRLTLVYVEPTNVCNLECRMCYSQNPIPGPPRQRGFMQFETYKRIIDELSTYGYTLTLWLHFGARCYGCDVEKVGFVRSSRNLGETKVSYNDHAMKYESRL